jgi:hypothetical protein
MVQKQKGEALNPFYPSVAEINLPRPETDFGNAHRYLAGVPLMTLKDELGHESLLTTQKYLADVRREELIKKAVADADFAPKQIGAAA